MRESRESLAELVQKSNSTWYVRTHIDGHYIRPNGTTGPLYAVHIDYGGEPLLLAHVANPSCNKINQALRWRAQLREASGNIVTIIRISLGGSEETTLYETGATNTLGSLPSLKETYDLLAPIQLVPQEASVHVSRFDKG